MLCTVKWGKKVSCGGVFDLAVEQQQLFRKLPPQKKKNTLTSSIPMGAINFYMWERFFTLADMTFIPMGVMYLHARIFCTLAHMSSIPMGAMSELETCFEPV